MTGSRWVLCCAVLIVALDTIVSVAQTAETMAISGVAVIDTISGRTIPNSTVTIRDGIIISVMPGGAPPGGARRVDGRGKFLIPGLWDMHAHHQMTGEGSLPLFVANGVTGTRDMGADLDFILPLRQRSASGQILGPRIIAAGPILDDRPPDWPYRITVRTADEARNAVRMLKERGVDLIKVHDRTPPEAYQAIAEEARRQGLPFAGHLPRGITFEMQTATINPARSLGLETVVGSIDAGKRADMVLLDANPRDDIANVRRIHAVVIGGTLLDRPQLDATLAAVRKQFQAPASGR